MPDTRQFPLALGHEPRFGEEDFLVSRSNADAHELLGAWPDWPDPTVVLQGPPASGKSHLAAIWARRAGAPTVAAVDLSRNAVPELLGDGALVVEDIDAAGADEAALFHLLNHAAEGGASLLLTTSVPIATLPLRTADLLSRLRRAPLAAIEAPDDALIRALLVKLFADRQLGVDAVLVAYLALRIERSFAAARATVERLDEESLARGRRLTRQAAAEILGWAGEG